MHEDHDPNHSCSARYGNYYYYGAIAWFSICIVSGKIGWLVCPES